VAQARLTTALRDGQVGAGEPLVGRGGGIAHHHGDAVKGHVELVGCDLSQGGFGAGAQVDLAHIDGHLTIGVQGQK
jgi:hypothetical protein